LIQEFQILRRKLVEYSKRHSRETAREGVRGRAHPPSPHPLGINYRGVQGYSSYWLHLDGPAHVMLTGGSRPHVCCVSRWCFGQTSDQHWCSDL